MNTALFAIILMLVGIVILIAEVFIPSGGAISILGAACLAGSGWCAIQAWWGTNPAVFWTYVLSLFIMIPVGIGIGLWLLPRTSLGEKMLLKAPTSDEVDSYQEEREHLHGKIGKIGATATLMTPGGLVVVDGERLHAETHGVMLDPGTQIEVVEVRGARVLVREFTGHVGSMTVDDAAEMAAFAEAEPDKVEEAVLPEERAFAETVQEASTEPGPESPEEDFDPFFPMAESDAKSDAQPNRKPESNSEPPLDFDIPTN